MFGLTAMMGSAALTLDYGRMACDKQAAQNAADAAALAGALDLPNETKARTSAGRVATANGYLAASITFTRDNLGQATRIRVQATRTVPMAFGAVFSQSRSVSAVARVSAAFPANKSYEYLPWGVQMQDWLLGQQVTLKQGGGGDQPAPGNFHALSLAGLGSDNYRSTVHYGYAGVMSVGDWVTTEPGNVSGPTEQGLDDRLADAAVAPYSSDTYNSLTPGNPRVVLIPLVDWTLGNTGRMEVPIVGFAAFWLQDAWGQGNCYVSGRFLQYVSPTHAVHSEDVLPGTDTGVRDPRLDL